MKKKKTTTIIITNDLDYDLCAWKPKPLPVFSRDTAIWDTPDSSPPPIDEHIKSDLITHLFPKLPKEGRKKKYRVTVQEL